MEIPIRLGTQSPSLHYQVPKLIQDQTTLLMALRWLDERKSIRPCIHRHIFPANSLCSRPSTECQGFSVSLFLCLPTTRALAGLNTKSCVPMHAIEAVFQLIQAKAKIHKSIDHRSIVKSRLPPLSFYPSCCKQLIGINRSRCISPLVLPLAFLQL